MEGRAMRRRSREVADPLPIDRELKAAFCDHIKMGRGQVADPLPIDRELKASFPRADIPGYGCCRPTPDR